MSKTTKTSPHKHRLRIFLALLLAVAVTLGIAGGISLHRRHQREAYQQWRASLPVRHAKHDTMAAQAESMFREYGKLQRALDSNGDKTVRYRKWTRDRDASTSYVDVQLDGTLVEISDNLFIDPSAADNYYLISLYPDVPHLDMGTCSSLLSIYKGEISAPRSCEAAKDGRPPLNLTESQQQDLTRRAMWKLIDTAAANWPNSASPTSSMERHSHER